MRRSNVSGDKPNDLFSLWCNQFPIEHAQKCLLLLSHVHIHTYTHMFIYMRVHTIIESIWAYLFTKNKSQKNQKKNQNNKISTSTWAVRRLPVARHSNGQSKSAKRRIKSTKRCTTRCGIFDLTIPSVPSSALSLFDITKRRCHIFSFSIFLYVIFTFHFFFLEFRIKGVILRYFKTPLFSERRYFLGLFDSCYFLKALEITRFFTSVLR